MSKKIEGKTYGENKKALFDYEKIEEYEAGIRLYGEEVKSIREGNINLKGSYIIIDRDRIIIIGMHIGTYKYGRGILDTKRERELLLSKKEILRLKVKVKEIGGTIVPISVYPKGNLIKISIALVKSRKIWQKKELLKNRDIQKEIAKNFR